MTRWTLGFVLSLAMAGMLTMESLAQDEGEDACSEACYAAEEACYASCEMRDDFDACADSCREAAETCLERCD